ncbi:hypothetical protein OCO53_25495 [Peribacillus frigoritolerans]|uniref:Rok-like winged helix domain-containing protein n=1 Tax=Peribacillus frigoritolerans TaxID=450367 RepID=UPI0021D0F1E1|nr:hypothetical protein [Peribacillus frigoritolerans]MCU6603798.1 hypothetical protein [Peribacillus frigoritolerans]
MFTERNAIEEQLHENKRAIRELRDSNIELIKRLREIDERDMKSSSIDIFEHLTSSMTDIIGQLSELIPHVPATAVIEHIKEKYNAEEMIEDLKEDKPDPDKTQVEVAVAAAAKEQKLHSIAPTNIPKERAATIVKSIFEKNGPELKSKFIEQEFYNETGKKYHNFGSTMNAVMEIMPSIKRISRGLYLCEGLNEKDNNETQNENLYKFA